MLVNHLWLTGYWRDECAQLLQDQVSRESWSKHHHLSLKFFFWNKSKGLFGMFSLHQIFLFSLKRWVHFGKDLELLDSPGIIPMRISDQSAAIKLAICDDIGERSYDVADVAAILVQMLKKIPAVGMFLLSLQRLWCPSSHLFLHLFLVVLFAYCI